MGLIGEDGQPLKTETPEPANASPEEVAAALKAAQIEALGAVLAKWSEKTLDEAARASLAAFLLEDENAHEIRAITFPASHRVEIEQRPDGRLSVLGPQNPRLVLSLLRSATDEVQLGFLHFRLMEKIAGQPKIAKPSMRDVLGIGRFGKKD